MAADGRYPVNARIACTNFDFVMEYHNFPVIKIEHPARGGFAVAPAGPLPTPAPSVHAFQMEAMRKVIGPARQEHMSVVQMHAHTVLALHEMDRQHGQLYGHCFSMIAACLLRLHRFELALAYAVAATRVQPRPRVLALICAARAAHKLALPGAMLRMLQQVRPVLLCS